MIVMYKKQRAVYDFVCQYMQKYGYSPTLVEIGKALHLNSLSTVHEHIENLVDKGLIKRFAGAKRGLEVIQKDFSKANEGIEVAVIGEIRAGKPIEPHIGEDMTIKVAPSMISANKRTFVLKVKGDSMIDDGILDGDYVLVEQQNTASNGDIVVALLENGLATLKRFFKEQTRIRLEPANARMSPIYASDVTIQGKVVGVIRRY